MSTKILPGVLVNIRYECFRKILCSLFRKVPLSLKLLQHSSSRKNVHGLIEAMCLYYQP
ncbi:hypothetical protein T07_4432 [Trichinella nelsoni]|uniref:Uncharacterized protein n=1 Tax=Trichinella nelsoni TaxID=6336 RepID=A0A0V0RC49_9BILA|nr:hypothetical protein T07_4432 [Trichinella nelsoni]